MAFEREELIDLAIMGLGAGAKGAVTGYVKNLLPGVSEDIAAVVVGGALFYFGARVHPYVRTFGAGILIAGIGQLVKGIIPAPGGSPSPSPQAPATADQLAALAQAQASVQAVYS